MSADRLASTIGGDTPPRVRQLFRYWSDIRGSRAMPRRADFDPIQIPAHLPGLLLIDVVGDAEDGFKSYRYRVVGEWEVAARGHNPTGKLIEDGFFGPSLNEAFADYDFVRRHRSPLCAPLNFADGRGRWIEEHSIILPFSEDDRRVSQILVYSERRQRLTGRNDEPATE